MGDMLSTAAGFVGSGLKNGYAWIKDEAGNFVGWTVELVTFGKVDVYKRQFLCCILWRRNF